jgi:hypothetical protein
MKKKEFTLKQMEKLYGDVAMLEKQDRVQFILVPPKIKKSFDRAWKKLPWYQKVWINMSRLIHGFGLYPLN